MNKIKRFLLQVYLAVKEIKRNIEIVDKNDFMQARLEADIIRYVHSIEKGLSISNPRLGFGIEKINQILSLCKLYLENGYENIDCIYFAKDALMSYFTWNKQNSFENEALKELNLKYESVFDKIQQKEDIFGGVIEIEKKDFEIDIEMAEKLFNTRHSIREFSGEQVTDEEIKKAIKLAQRSPSACNRQGVRIYSVSSKKYIDEIGQSLEGIGGFAHEVDKFLLITAKQSAYGLFEKNQFIVSASMFAGYLTLALHAYQIAACTVQRSLSVNKLWDSFREKNNIPKDEQIVVMIGVGKYKEKTMVPVSKRFDVNYIYKNLDKK